MWSQNVCKCEVELAPNTEPQGQILDKYIQFMEKKGDVEEKIEIRMKRGEIKLV